jgi:hypothetical protein
VCVNLQPRKRYDATLPRSLLRASANLTIRHRLIERRMKAAVANDRSDGDKA